MTAILLAAMLAAAPAQAPSQQTGFVVDVSGAAVPGAEVAVTEADGRTSSRLTADDGSFVIPAGATRVVVRSPGFAEATIAVTARADGTLRVVLQPASFADAVVVTAGRGAERLPEAASATVLTSAVLANSAGGALDDVLRHTPGFSLFRRSSSRVANPTTQGVTLRGVSGSGASRTLVLADGVPLNDPFGSWVYWNRVPAAAVDRVEIVRGAVGDMYGADALGGVVQVLTFAPGRPRMRATVDGGSHDTGRLSFFGGGSRGGWFGSLSGEGLRTDGVVTMAPEVAGPVDVRADSDYRTGFATIGYQQNATRGSLRFSAYSETRGNGTPRQVNSTAWRQLSGEVAGVAANGAWEARLSSGSQEYYQTFSAVAADRASERLTTEQWTPSDFLSAAAQYSRGLGRHALIVGGELHRTEATVDEYRYSLQGVRSGPFVVGGTERTLGLFARGQLSVNDHLTVGLGARADFWRSEPLDAALAAKSVSFFSPRASATWRAGRVSLMGAVYRAHRTPTLNELHRGFRVGNAVTNPNPLLEPETLTGVEGGVLVRAGRASARATAFYNTLDGAIANVTLSSTPALITRERRNSDEIRAKGLELEADVRLHATVTVNALAVFTASRFHGSIATPALAGNRVPQVPRVQLGGGVTWSDPELLTIAVQVRGTGEQFDDDLNRFALGGYSVTDVQVSRSLGRTVQVFVSVENLFDKDYDTGRTPLRTVGWPRTTRVGLRVALP
ncbi:MAG: TonB-dependent receptor [Acidobacteriota bacterium]